MTHVIFRKKSKDFLLALGYPALFVVSMALLALFSSGCAKEDGGASGRYVSFSTSSSYDNSPASKGGSPSTKTSYSGDASGGLERINWENSDIIRILSDKAKSGSDSFSDYRVKLQSNSGKVSKASLSPYSGNGLVWGTGEHKFYAVYPSPVTTGMSSSVNLTYNSTKGTGVVDMTIPGMQTYTREGTSTTLKPNMNYAYMWAASKSGVSANVGLSFRPMFTAFQFSIFSKDDSEMTVTSFSLSSASKALWGSCKATLPADPSSGTATFTDFPVANASNKKISVSFGSGITVKKSSSSSTSGSLTFTVFALPQDYNDLTVSFTTSKGETKKFALNKSNGQGYLFEALAKHNVSGLGLPGQWTYTLDAIDDIQVNGLLELTAKVSVKSYKTRGTAKKGVPWKIKALSAAGNGTYVEHGDPNWPSWITLSAYEGVGSQTGEELLITTSRAGQSEYGNVRLKTTTTIPIRDVTPVGTKEQPRDLCLYDINGKLHPGGTVTSITSSGAHTANCYVINAPGWYCFPLVYGNAIDRTRGNSSGEYQAAYTSNSFSNIKPRYKNADNNPIGSPYILNDGNLDLSGNYDAIAVWHDVKWSFEFISNASCEVINAPTGAGVPGCKYIRFYADPEKIIDGNVMIALQDKGKDKILWSWHIWVRGVGGGRSSLEVDALTKSLNETLGWAPPLSYSFSDIPARNSILKVVPQEGNATAVDFSVKQNASTGGAIADAIYSCTYYQWGRKDPFIGRKSAALGLSTNLLLSYYPFGGEYKYNENAINYIEPQYIVDRSNNVINYVASSGSGSSSESAYESMGGNFGEMIKKPHKLSYNDPNPSRFDLWNFNVSSSVYATSKDHAALSQAVGKTVYDPCPAGFTVPRGNFYVTVQYPREDDGNGWIKAPASLSEIYGSQIEGSSLFPQSWSFSLGRIYGMGFILPGPSGTIPPTNNVKSTQSAAHYWTAVARQGSGNSGIYGNAIGMSCYVTGTYVGNGYFFVLNSRAFSHACSILPVLES